jgi:hypothetical protein
MEVGEGVAVDWDEVGNAFREAFHAMHLAGVTGVAAFAGAGVHQSSGCTLTNTTGICGQSAESIGLQAGGVLAGAYIAGVFVYAVVKAHSKAP